MKTCDWVPLDNPVYVRYHDCEWGVPVHDDREWFEFLLLEGAQAGLSWLTVLKKRENYRRLFDGFDPVKVSLYDDAKVACLMQNPGIIRNQLKIRSAIKNARAFLDVQEKFGSFDSYIWDFVDGHPKINAWKKTSEIPTRTKISDTMSKDLKARGFSFVGSTICYAHMQATGMVNDHLVDCFRYPEINALNDKTVK